MCDDILQYYDLERRQPSFETKQNNLSERMESLNILTEDDNCQVWDVIRKRQNHNTSYGTFAFYLYSIL